jgi:hypothetical protein
MADQSLGCPQKVIHADAEADLLDDSVRVLGVDIVLDGNPTVLLELRWRDLHQIRNLCLQAALDISE